MIKNVIEINNLSKKINGYTILDEINLSINEGEVCSIIGSNGSGKSMLLKSIAGLIHPDNGSINILGNIKIGQGDFPENIGVLFDTPGLIPEYSAFKNLKILASINKIATDIRIKELLSSFGLNPNDKRPIKKYSLGMKQKVGIVQALMEYPKILILDEPMNGLDKESIELVRRIILELKEKKITIILTSHNDIDIDILSDKIYKMEQGRLLNYDKESDKL